MEREKYYELINKYPSVKEYEDWKKENGIDFESVLKGDLENEYKARNMVDERFQTIVKDKKAWYMTALRTTACQDLFLKYNILDETILGWLIWNETKSVDALYEVANSRWNDTVFAATAYEDMVYFLKANGEFVDATNPKVRRWGRSSKWQDGQFDVDGRIQRLEGLVMVNKDAELLKRLANEGREGK